MLDFICAIGVIILIILLVLMVAYWVYKTLKKEK